MTHCNANPLLFQDLDSRQVLAAFDGGKVTSDGGGLLLREVDSHFHFLEQFARCFTDHRDPDRLEHTVLELLKQRVFGLCLGYEDLNDHDQLRLDPLLAVLVGKMDPLGEDRRNAADRGKALAGKSTLNRLELTAVGADTDTRYKKIVAHLGQIENFLVDVFVQQHVLPPQRLVLDLDATDDPVHGHQLGHFFHGYYDHDCFLPLYIFCGDHPLCAVLRPSDLDASAGSLVYVQRLVTRLRQAWPNVRLVLRGDSGFCRDYLMRWCEAHDVDFLFGLAKNQRLLRIVGQELQQAQGQYEQTRQPARVFKDFEYRTHKSWSRSRRVVGKAEHLAKGSNPRFVVTSLSTQEFDGRTLYEQQYCARGDMENRIKEQQLWLFADRTSCETMRANQVRLYLSTVAYIVLRALREFGLRGTELAQAQCGSIRCKLLKIGGVIRVTVRRVVVALSEACPFREVFTQVWENLRRLRESPRVAAPAG
jgi:Transposase DDE domain group 1